MTGLMLKGGDPGVLECPGTHTSSKHVLFHPPPSQSAPLMLSTRLPAILRNIYVISPLNKVVNLIQRLYWYRFHFTDLHFCSFISN